MGIFQPFARRDRCIASLEPAYS